MVKLERIKSICLIAFFAILWLLLAVKTLPMVFMTNDDASIQATLSGIQIGNSYPYHQFINSILGFFISVLYYIIPSIPWWYAWSIYCVLIGIICIQWTVFKTASHKIEAILFVAIFGLSFWIYVLGNIAFTVVPCIVVLGVVFLLFSKDYTNWNYLLVIIASIVILISSWHRQSTGMVMFCYFAMALLYYVSSCVDLDMKHRCLRYVGVLGIVFILMFASSEIDQILKEQRDSDEFRAYNSARVAYMDYPHVSYKDNPDVYKAFGWDENLTSLVNSWCFLDERVTAEAFSTIAAAEVEHKISDSENDIVEENFFMPLLNLIENNEFADIWTHMIVCILILGEVYICLCDFVKSKINFFYVSNVVGSIILVLYLIARERLPLRAYMIILIPTFLISCLLLIKVHRIAEVKHNILWYAFIGVLLMFAVPSFLCNYDAESIEKKVYTIENCNAIDSYLNGNSENIYISDFSVYNSIYPFAQTPVNLIHWGGSTFHSEQFYLHLQKNGLSELNMETFKQENVYFVTKGAGPEEYSKTACRILKCLEDYGAIGMERIDVINGTCDVYKFYFEEMLE